MLNTTLKKSFSTTAGITATTKCPPFCWQIQKTMQYDCQRGSWGGGTSDGAAAMNHKTRTHIVQERTNVSSKRKKKCNACKSKHNSRNHNYSTKGKFIWWYWNAISKFTSIKVSNTQKQQIDFSGPARWYGGSDGSRKNNEKSSEEICEQDPASLSV